MKVNVEIEVTQDALESLIVSAIEGGSNYWYRIESSTKGDYLKTLFTSGLVISDFNGQDGDERKTVKTKVNKDVMKKALTLMAEKYPRHFADFVSDNADAETGDVFLQLCVLNDVIYG